MPRTQRQAIQNALGPLGDVHPYRWIVEDLEHPAPGWWATPEHPAPGCGCDLCQAARAGRDLHLGSIARVAIMRAGAIAEQHASAAAA